MTAIYRKTGEIIDYTPTIADVDAGEWVVQGSLVGLTKQKIEKDRLGAIATSGVFDGVAKAAGSALTLGCACWLDTTDKKIYAANASGRVLVGVALKAAASADTECSIFLYPGIDGDCNGFSTAANVAVPAAVTGVALTDSTGGTSYTNHTLKAIEDSYTKATVAGNIATIATQVEANRADISALRTTVAAIISALIAADVMAAS